MMITPPSIPPPPDLDNLAGWIGGLVVLAVVIVGAVIRGIGAVRRIGKAIRETIPEEHATKIITTDTVAMEHLGETIEKGNELAVQTNALLAQLVQVVGELAKQFREDRQEADLNDKIKQQLEVQIDLFKKALKKPPAPRRRPPKPPQS